MKAYGVLPLKPIAESPGKWTQFKVMLTLRGLYAGTFEGEYALQLESAPQ